MTIDRFIQSHVKVNQATKTMESQLTKEKEAQYAIYLELVQTEGETLQADPCHPSPLHSSSST